VFAQNTLAVEVLNMCDKGTIMIALFKGEAGFPKKMAAASVIKKSEGNQR
jgi:uncharacterized protein (DUF2141 family)